MLHRQKAEMKQMRAELHEKTEKLLTYDRMMQRNLDLDLRNKELQRQIECGSAQMSHRMVSARSPAKNTVSKLDHRTGDEFMRSLRKPLPKSKDDWVTITIQD